MNPTISLQFRVSSRADFSLDLELGEGKLYSELLNTA